MVVRFHGGTLDQLALYEQIKRKMPGNDGQWGVYNSDLVAAMKTLGFEAGSLMFDYFDHRAMAKDLDAHFKAGRGPLIATQRTAVKVPTGHSRVIVGVEEEKNGSGPFVIVHDPGSAQPHRQGGIPVPLGGSNKRWASESFATLWQPKGWVTHGGEALWIRPP